MIDYHGTFIFSTGGTITEKEWSFSAIDISKATLKLKFENAGSGTSPIRFRIEYYDSIALEWKTLGEIVQDWCGTRWCPNKYMEFDVTSICKANPKFRWRAVVSVPFTIYYSCMTCTAYLYLEYTLGEPEATGVQSTTALGDETLAPFAESFEFMLNIMLMVMFMSMMMGMMTSIAGGYR
jgi:hypothetical protein